MSRLLALALLCAAPAALASAGRVVKLEGAATRTAAGGKAQALQVGSAIERFDVLEVKPQGLLKLELADGSELALDEKSKLAITQADFAGQELKAFSATLSAGKLWSRVKQLAPEATYEVRTQRAVAGVRGTIFRIDADALIQGARARRADVVRVVEGQVRVSPSATVAAKSRAAPAPPASGPRTAVAGPTEISAAAWEQRFAVLQEKTQLWVGVDLWEQAELDAAALGDRFQKWVDAARR